MARNSSATLRQQTPHVNRTTTTATIIDVLKQRARAVLNDNSIDTQTRAIIRYGLETNSLWLDLICGANEDYAIDDTLEFSEPSGTNEPSSNDHTANDDVEGREKIEALAEIICRCGDESPAALLVLMGAFENSSNPKVIANTAKHYAFARCAELNLFGMVDAQIAMAEGELLTPDTPS